MVITIVPTQFAGAQTTSCIKLRIGSWDGCEPIVQTLGPVSTDRNSAVVNVFYSSQGADFQTRDWPQLSVEYGLISENSFDNQTELRPQGKGSNTEGFLIGGLDEGKWYQYRAVLSWVGGVKYGEIKKFQAVKKITVPTPVTTSTSSSTSTATTNSTSSSSTTTNTTSTKPKTTATTSSSNNTGSLTSTGGFSIFGFGNSTKTNNTPTSVFNNVDERAGFRLAIDDGKTEIRQGDTVTIKVRYENNNTKSFSNGTVEIYLPDQLAVTGTNKGIIDKVGNSVVISLRDFPAGAFGTAIVTAQATGKAGDLDQVMTQVGMKIGGVVLKVADIDEYIAGSSSSSLGASASGTGFLPASIIGWLLLLIILAAIVIIGRRYFVKKDY
jgi:hypothetical protein